MQAAIRNTPSTKDPKHMEKRTRRPVNQGWSKMQGGSKKVKSKVGATVGDHSKQQGYLTKISEKCPDSGSKAVGGYRTRGKKRGQYAPHIGKSESTSVSNRSMGGLVSTWSSQADLGRQQYSVRAS